MAEEEREFQLSEEEAASLGRLAQQDQRVGILLENFHRPVGRSLILRLSRARSELIRDRLTELLATTGFAAGYSLNQNGQMIETLIDRFFWGKGGNGPA